MVEAHDQAVLWLRSGEESEEGEAKAVAIFEQSCAEGLSVGCTNLGYMRAAGRGGERDHRQALDLFSQHCPRAGAGVGSGSAPGEEVFLSHEFDGSQACEQWEVLAKGLFEERVISSFEAEQRELLRCYEEAMSRSGSPRAGRITLKARVDGEGSGGAPSVGDDRLELEGVSECLQRVLRRHLEDGAGPEAPFRVQWSVSFLHRPDWKTGDGEEEEVVVGCDPEEVRRGVGAIYANLESCGQEHLKRYPEDPGVVLIRWEVEPGGEVGALEWVTTVENEGVLQCLESVVRGMRLSAFEGGECPVQLPLRLSEGRYLHFSVISR